MLEIRNINGGYNKKQVLHDVSFYAQKGKITSILGSNGSGKSTLLKSLCSIIPVTSGEVLLDNKNLLGLPQNEIAQKIAYLSQTKQIPDISVKRLVLHGRFPYLNYPRRYKEKDYIIVNKVMEKMDILDLANVPISKLSGGQQQKAYLAMALAQDTDVILLDEPTTYLDISFQLQVIKEIKNLANDGKYILMVLHDISLALENSDNIVLIKDGTIVKQGTPKNIYESNILEKVFNVKVARVEIDNKYHYFCKTKNT